MGMAGEERRGKGGEGCDSGRLTTTLRGMRTRHPAIQCPPAPCSQLQWVGNSRGNKSSCLPLVPASACRGDEEAVRHLTYPIALLTALLYPTYLIPFIVWCSHAIHDSLQGNRRSNSFTWTRTLSSKSLFSRSNITQSLRFQSILESVQLSCSKIVIKTWQNILFILKMVYYGIHDQILDLFQ